MALTKISTDTIDLSSDTTALKMPKGTTAQRPGLLPVNYLVVAGGGAGGVDSNSGGGGAGGLRTSFGSNTGGGGAAEISFQASIDTPYTVTVGLGASVPAIAPPYSGGDGGNSVFATITSTGGGGGSGASGGLAGRTGGSGGGGAYLSNAGGAAVTNPVVQGYAGAAGQNSAGLNYPGGGGGGAGEVGNTDGNGYGGDGLAVNIITTAMSSTYSVGEVDGSDVYFAGGGGGGLSSPGTNPPGGKGGGGQGAGDPSANAAGSANTGGGGGGFGPNSTSGEAGGSGVVILREPQNYTATFTSGVTANGVSGGGAISPDTSTGDNVWIVTATSDAFQTVTFSGTAPTIGETRENTTTGKMEIYTGVTGWRALQQTDQAAAGIVGTNNFDTSLYVGDAGLGNTTSQSITSLNFQPDLIWVKNRDNANNNVLFDSTRGATKWLNSNNTNQEYSNSYTGASFLSNGFTTGTSDQTNRQGNNIVAWGWKAGGSGSDNFYKDGVGYADATAAGMNAGTITPSGSSVNTESGFSIVSWTGGSSASNTTSHGFSDAPEFIVQKQLDTSGEWYIYHKDLTSGYSLKFTTAAESNALSWTVDSSIFYPNWTNTSYDWIAYCWRSIPGYSLIGSYIGTGNASNAPLIYTGFLPAWIMVKCANGTGAWNITDNKRSTTNPRNSVLQASAGDIEYTQTNYNINFYNDGFQIVNADSGWNDHGENYIFMCFAS